MENRVIAHFDIDCFYAQSEELRCPSLRGRPVGVTQKFLVVTSNYVARGLGVPKMVSIAEAKRKVPELVLVNGEDLTAYRADSKRIGNVLKRFGTVERHGLDEGAVDITAQVEARLQSGAPAISFVGHVLGLRGALRTGDGLQSRTLFNFESTPCNLETLPPADVLLLVGSQVVAEIRTSLEKETGFRCSCGVAQNKMLAKLTSSLNKPNMQTCLLQGGVAEFLLPMSVRRIPGVGQHVYGLLAGMNVETIADLGKVTLKQLSERLGTRIALLLFNAAQGQDPSPVHDKGPPKSISVEDSFRSCRTMQHILEILRDLAPYLIRRLDEDRDETGRIPKSFTVKWRVQGPKWNFTSVSTRMPPDLLSPSTALEKRVCIAVDVAARLLSNKLQEPFNLAVLNVGATVFESAPSSPGICDIPSFLQRQGKSPGIELKVNGKKDARINRESSRAMPSGKSRGVASEVQFEDENYLSNNSEDDELDDLADLLGVAGRQTYVKQRNDRKSHIEDRTSELVQQRFPREGETMLSMKQSLSPSKMANEAPFCCSLRRHHETDGAVPSARNLFEACPPVGVSVQEVGTHGNFAGPDSKDLANANSENNSRSVHTCESRLTRLAEPNVMLTKEISYLNQHPGSSAECCGREHICVECGEMVENTDSRRQEHADYHFAESLDMQERFASPELPAESSRVPSTARRERVTLAAPPPKKSKLRNGTLDGFVVRFP